MFKISHSFTTKTLRLWWSVRNCIHLFKSLWGDTMKRCYNIVCVLWTLAASMSPRLPVYTFPVSYCRAWPLRETGSLTWPLTLILTSPFSQQQSLSQQAANRLNDTQAHRVTSTPFLQKKGATHSKMMDPRIPIRHKQIKCEDLTR